MASADCKHCSNLWQTYVLSQAAVQVFCVDVVYRVNICTPHIDRWIPWQSGINYQKARAFSLSSNSYVHCFAHYSIQCHAVTCHLCGQVSLAVVGLVSTLCTNQALTRYLQFNSVDKLVMLHRSSSPTFYLTHRVLNVKSALVGITTIISCFFFPIQLRKINAEHPLGALAIMPCETFNIRSIN